MNKDARLSKSFRAITYNNFILLALNILLPVLITFFSYHVMRSQVDLIKNPIVISIEDNERYAIDTASHAKQWFTLVGLKDYCLQQIQEQKPNHVSIWLKSNPTVAYGKILDIIRWLNTKGITKVSLVTENAPQSE